MTTFPLNMRSEMLKCRRTAAFWLTVLGACIVPFAFLLVYGFKPDPISRGLQGDSWWIHISHLWQSTASFLLPMYVILVTSLVVQVEFRNNTWKQVYASPRRYEDIYFSKFAVIHLLIVAYFVLFTIALVLSAYLANLWHSRYGFFDQPIPWGRLLGLTGRLYLSVLGVAALQYWLSNRFKNFIVPLGLGLALLITGMIILNWEHIRYYPYAYPLLAYLKNITPVEGSTSQPYLMYSVIWFSFFLFAGFVDLSRRKEY